MFYFCSIYIYMAKKYQYMLTLPNNPRPWPYSKKTARQYQIASFHFNHHTVATTDRDTMRSANSNLAEPHETICNFRSSPEPMVYQNFHYRNWLVKSFFWQIVTGPYKTHLFTIVNCYPCSVIRIKSHRSELCHVPCHGHVFKLWTSTCTVSLPTLQAAEPRDMT